MSFVLYEFLTSFHCVAFFRMSSVGNWVVLNIKI